MIVVDASVVIDMLLLAPFAPSVTDRLLADGETLHAPHLLDLEVLQILRRNARAGRLDRHRGQQAVDDLRVFPVLRHSATTLLPRIWELRHNLSAYDAAYVALAEALNAPLVTRDGFLAASPGHRAQIELI